MGKKRMWITCFDYRYKTGICPDKFSIHMFSTKGYEYHVRPFECNSYVYVVGNGRISMVGLFRMMAFGFLPLSQRRMELSLWVEKLWCLVHLQRIHHGSYFFQFDELHESPYYGLCHRSAGQLFSKNCLWVFSKET